MRSISISRARWSTATNRCDRWRPNEKKYAFHEARFASLRFWITRVTDYAMRLGFGNGRDPRRFEMRLRQLEALGPEKFEAELF